MISINELRQLNTANHYMITEHARIRLFERNITIDDVICCVENGKIIEQSNHHELLLKHGRYYQLYTLQYHREQMKSART